MGLGEPCQDCGETHLPALRLPPLHLFLLPCVWIPVGHPSRPPPPVSAAWVHVLHRSCGTEDALVKHKEGVLLKVSLCKHPLMILQGKHGNYNLPDVITKKDESGSGGGAGGAFPASSR